MPVCKTKRPHLRPLTIINSAQPENKTVKVFQRKMCSVKHSKTNFKKTFPCKKREIEIIFSYKSFQENKNETIDLYTTQYYL